jgi:hypothetical protein
LSDQNLIKYYNTFQTIDLNSQKYKNIKELINYTKVRISNEIHQRDSIEKNIIQ